nr:unnamed protein product [Callosobruchus chinensis]
MYELDQLKKAEKGGDEAEDKNAMLKHTITQLEPENACKTKNPDNAIGETGNSRIKENKSKLGERLTQLERENKKLKSDSSNALDDATKSMVDLSRAQHNAVEQLLAKMKNDDCRLKKELEKTLAEAQACSSGQRQLNDESNKKIKQKIA